MKYTPAELLAKFMLQWHPAKNKGTALWRGVHFAFDVKYEEAKDICRAHGMDPDMMVKQRRL